MPKMNMNALILRASDLLWCGLSSRADPLCGFGGVSENFFPDNAFGGLVEVGVQGGLEFEEFGPEGPVDKGARGADIDRGVALTFIAEGFKPVAAAEGGEEAALPLIGHGELELGLDFSLCCGAKRLADALDGRGGRLAFARGGGAFEQGGNFAELIAELLFGGHEFASSRCCETA